MKKSQVINNILKPNRVIEGKENELPHWGRNKSNGIYIPKRKKH